MKTIWKDWGAGLNSYNYPFKQLKEDMNVLQEKKKRTSIQYRIEFSKKI